VGPAAVPDPRPDAVLALGEALARPAVPERALHLGLLLPAFGRSAFERLGPALLTAMERHPTARDPVSG